eukprot:s569_g26.t1
MVIGPAWTRGEMEKPAGTKDMGSWTAAVYTPEQQARLGVDESGKPKAAAPLASPVGVPKVGAIGPAWTRGEIEKPAGTKDMGGWTAGAAQEPRPQRPPESMLLDLLPVSFWPSGVHGRAASSPRPSGFLGNRGMEVWLVEKPA